MRSALRLLLQFIAYAALAVMLGYFATQPSYRYGNASQASVKVSLSHAAERVEPCKQLTQEEIAELAMNMRLGPSPDALRSPATLST